MILGPNKEWLFVSTTRTGTQTIYEALESIGGTRVDITEKIYHPRPKERLATVHFTSCRNPYDRAVSMWSWTCLPASGKRAEIDLYKAQHQIKSAGGAPNEFIDFLKHVLLRSPVPANKFFWNQASWHDLFVYDKVVHLENLEEELSGIVGAVNPRCGIHPVDDHRSDHRPFGEYLTSESIDLINEWAGPDFKRYGYRRLKRWAV